MPEIRIPYHPLRVPVAPGATQLRSVFYPWVPVRVYRDRRSTPRLLLLVDSGADYCVLRSDIGKELGIDIRTGEPCSLRGLGGGLIDAWLHDVELELENRRFPSRFAFTEAALPIPGMLGRSGFFDKFTTVAFEEKKRRLTLKY